MASAERQPIYDGNWAERGPEAHPLVRGQGA